MVSGTNPISADPNITSLSPSPQHCLHIMQSEDRHLSDPHSIDPFFDVHRIGNHHSLHFLIKVKQEGEGYMPGQLAQNRHLQTLQWNPAGDRAQH